MMKSPKLKIAAFPRDPNPYQGLLYSEMQRLGTEVSYLGELTPSRTLNVLLLPFELAAKRIAGTNIIHLHWVFGFSLPGARRFSCMRWVSYFWFRVWLRTCRALRMRLVWTAHNVLPHDQVFPDDISARLLLTNASDLIIAHSHTTLAELAALGCVGRQTTVIPHGPINPKRCTPLRVPGTGTKHRQLLFLGRIHDYKGVEDLLSAFGAIIDDIDAHLTVAGQCDDAALRSRLEMLAPKNSKKCSLRLERIPEEEISDLLEVADVVVLPFRQVTTSGSAMLALSYGRPLIVPGLDALADFPDQAVFRYEGEATGLRVALKDAARVDSETLARMSDAAFRYASETTWLEIANKTVHEMKSIHSGMLGDQSLGRES